MHGRCGAAERVWDQRRRRRDPAVSARSDRATRPSRRSRGASWCRGRRRNTWENSGRFDSGPLTRYCGGECGLVCTIMRRRRGFSRTTVGRAREKAAILGEAVGHHRVGGALTNGAVRAERELEAAQVGNVLARRSLPLTCVPGSGLNLEYSSATHPVLVLNCFSVGAAHSCQGCPWCSRHDWHQIVAANCQSVMLPIC